MVKDNKDAYIKQLEEKIAKLETYVCFRQT